VTDFLQPFLRAVLIAALSLVPAPARAAADVRIQFTALLPGAPSARRDRRRPARRALGATPGAPGYSKRLQRFEVTRMLVTPDSLVLTLDFELIIGGAESE
jgi:hypothetical protein